MKVKQERVQAGRASNQKKFSTQLGVIVVMIIAVIAIFIINMMSTKSLKETVEIAVFKEAVTQGSLISESNIVSRSMLAAEYLKEAELELADGSKRRAIILYEDRAAIVGTYAGYYMKEGTPLYWSAFTKSNAKKNSYLYQMDGELIKLSVSADVFGEMIMPGDRVNIRCKYTEQNYELPTIEEYEAMQQLGMEMNTSVTKQVMLFSEVSILDMLNGNGESIFDYYYDFVNLPVSQQRALLEDDSFKSATQPSEIMLCVTAEEADMYFALQDKGPQYMLTLLPREGSNLILDALNALNTSN